MLRGLGSKLKFLDESHFIARKLHGCKIKAPKGMKIFITADANLKSNYSLTLLCSIDGVEEINIRELSNDQWDFTQFLIKCIENNALVNGI